MNVPGRADLDAWAAWLDSQGVPHSGVNDTDDPIPYSTLIFRDPDNIQLELFRMPADQGVGGRLSWGYSAATWMGKAPP
jgi:hypothetical protein